jgi:hypothetical protein
MMELAWAAGLFDGEGNIHISYSRSAGKRMPYLSLSIHQVDPYVLHRFLGAVGIGKVLGPYRYLRRNWKPQWHYVVQAQGSIISVVELLWPWLSPIKKDQYYRCLEIYRAARKKE